MATNESSCEGVIPLRLQRFLMTVARREGMENIKIGVIVSSDENMIIVDKENKIPNVEIENGDFESALKTVAKNIGINEFLAFEYVGAFSYTAENGVTTKQYNFTVNAKIPEMLCEGFKFVYCSAASKFLSKKEAQALALLMEKKKTSL